MHCQLCPKVMNFFPSIRNTVTDFPNFFESVIGMKKLRLLEVFTGSRKYCSLNLNDVTAFSTFSRSDEFSPFIWNAVTAFYWSHEAVTAFHLNEVTELSTFPWTDAFSPFIRNAVTAFPWLHEAVTALHLPKCWLGKRAGRKTSATSLIFAFFAYSFLFHVM